jgi:hypothetical protein
MVMPLAGRAVAAVTGGLLVLASAAAILLAQLAAWLIVAYAGFALLLWPFAARGLVSAFTDAGSSLFTRGFAVPAGAVPTLYGAFNRRETDMARLNARAGVPSWGPELLARTYMGHSAPGEPYRQ